MAGRAQLSERECIISGRTNAHGIPGALCHLASTCFCSKQISCLVREPDPVSPLFVDVTLPDDQIARMIQDTVENLEKLGRDVAEEVAGPGCVEQVEVAAGVDYFERPVYDFSFLIDLDRARLRPGLILIRLDQRLQDELIARGDEHHPVVRLLDHTDWPRRASARTV